MSGSFKEKAQILLPPALARGDTIGLVAPSGPVADRDIFAAGVRLLREMGFEVKFDRILPEATNSYLAGSDKDRADEFNRLWADEEVKALLAVRGGYGSLRMVGMLDFELIRNTPKMFLGFSDITVLLNVLHQETSLVTMHAPVLTTLTRSDRKSVASFFQAITGNLESEIHPDHLEILVDGQARGRLTGGNLTTLVHLLGTPYEIKLDDAIFFLEDVSEAPYRVDRMLTQLQMAGQLDHIHGLILGSFVAEAFGHDGGREHEAVWHRVLELVGDMDIPVWANFPVGHGARNYTLPIGAEVEMDSAAGTLYLLDPLS
jgi:muramoyltetrapeptide carboxypeptidase